MQKSNSQTEDIWLDFEAYLKQIFKGPNSPSTTRSKVKKFIDWITQKGYQEIKYPEMMEYIRHCRTINMEPKNINSYLRAIRHFYDYLEEEKSNYLNHKMGYNPARNIHIKGLFRGIIADYLNEEEMQNLRENYKGNQQILLALLIYQGLNVNEIEKLEKAHFDFKKGTVYIQKSLKSNRRILKLEAVQLYELMEHTINLKTESLLGQKLNNQVFKLSKALKKINPKVRNAQYLRGSRISFWVRNHDIREAQYLAGHKTISATEKYRLVNLEDLQNQINIYHPLSK